MVTAISWHHHSRSIIIIKIMVMKISSQAQQKHNHHENHGYDNIIIIIIRIIMKILYNNRPAELMSTPDQHVHAVDTDHRHQDQPCNTQATIRLDGSSTLSHLKYHVSTHAVIGTGGSAHFRHKSQLHSPDCVVCTHVSKSNN